MKPGLNDVVRGVLFLFGGRRRSSFRCSLKGRSALALFAVVWTWSAVLVGAVGAQGGKRPVIDRNRLEGAGFILSGEPRADKKIFASERDVETLGEDDVVYLNVGAEEGVGPGSRFTIYRPTRAVVHPMTGEVLGYLIAVSGALEVMVADEKVATARITDSYNSPIFKGDRITPFEENPLPLIDPSQAPPEKNVHGFIVATKDDKEYVGQDDIVYLDRGSRDGVAPGDYFRIYQAGRMLEAAELEGLDLPRVQVGELVVIATEDRTATALIVRSATEVWAGNPVSYK